MDAAKIKSTKYSENRPPTMKSNDSPLIYFSDKNDIPTYREIWFISHPIGVYKLNRLQKSMAKKANLHSKPLTSFQNSILFSFAHCFLV
jgi:hypothetical protein